MTAPAPQVWPRLSEDLPGARSRMRCQACGLAGAPPTIEWWQEHDDADQPEPIVITLCWSCAPTVVPPHPRLYRQLAPNEPLPGAMQLCDGCQHRDTRAGLRCGNPRAHINGGPGLSIQIAKPMVGFVDFRGRDGRRTGRPMRWWPTSASGCSGRELAP